MRCVCVIILLLVLSAYSVDASFLDVYSVLAIDKDESSTNLSSANLSFLSFPSVYRAKYIAWPSFRPRRRLLWDYCEFNNLRRPVFGMAIKNNLVYDAFTIPNLGFEFGFKPQWTVDLSVSYDAFNRKNNSTMKHFYGHAELRYWPCQQFDGHFFGAYIQSGIYNVGGELPYGIEISELMKYRYEGSLYGGGFSYGYHVPLGLLWAVEMTVSVGYAHINYDRYRCVTCGSKLDSGTKNYFGPTRLGVSWMYMIN